MASPNLSTEVTARLQFPIEEPVHEFNVKVIQFEDNDTQAYKTNDVKAQAWELVYSEQKDDEFTALMAFYDARKGPYEKFYWNHPITGEADIPVRFDWEQGPPAWRWDGPATREVRFRIRRVK